MIIAHYNGMDMPLHDVKIPILDRAYLFGDAVYEVLRIYRGVPFLFHEHLARLKNSLDAMAINYSGDIAALVEKNIADNNIVEGMVYIEISRGVAQRNHSFYKLSLNPSIVIYCTHFPEHPSERDFARGISAITHDDIRWGLCRIKTVNLLANCLIQTKAHARDCSEALLLRDGKLTEGTSSNVFVVKNNEFITPPLSDHILPGTRRAFLIRELRRANKIVIERDLYKHELFDADEIFITSSIKEVLPVIFLDENPIGRGVGENATFARRLIDNAAS